MSEEMLSGLDQVYANANRLVGAVGADQWDDKTPCTEWTVRDLVDHMTATSVGFQASATRSEPATGADTSADPVAGFRAASESVLRAWHTDGAMDGEVTTPLEMPAVAAAGINLIDIGVHCWDLATAIGADHGLAPEMVDAIDEWNHRIVTDEIRGQAGFGPALEPASDDRLSVMLAFVGRRG